MKVHLLTPAWLEQARALEQRCFADAWSESLWQLYLPHACSYLLCDDDSSNCWALLCVSGCWMRLSCCALPLC
ncbi:hypothetical protein LH51_11750 [Nitrincola sp. A-D6]|nr:hypothetical protein LH51_11750 [Nitrincola sp. A-D6]